MSSGQHSGEGRPARRIVVAVDGPAGSGKSSVSRAAAKRLGFDFQDTGAAYRALAWRVLELHADPDNADHVVAALDGFDYALGIDPDRFFVTVGGTDVTELIRQPQVSTVVSKVARVPLVRERLTELFRSIIASSTRPGIIVEGRDITTVVAPDATVRVLLTASPHARAARRSAQSADRPAHLVAEHLASRDAQDSLVVDFMNAADGVTVLDSTDLDFDATVTALVELVRSAA